MEVTIEKLVYGGHGLSRTDGRVMMTPFVLPGERAIIEPVDKLHANLVSLVQAAPQRTDPPCPYFGECGGCHYQHMDYATQLQQKVAVLRDVLRRVGKFDAPEEIQVVSGPELNYRNRVQLHVLDGELGYLRTGSHDLCPIGHCPISSPKINEAIPELAEMVSNRRFPSFVRTIEMFTNETELQLNVLETDQPVARHFFDWCAEQIPGYAAGALNYGGFRVGPRSFFQVNRFLVDALVDTALGDVAGEHALDLYAGVGLFSRPLAQRFAKVTAVESSKSAVSDLRENVPTAEAVRSSVDEYLAELTEAPEFVLADPPRDGLGKQAVRELIRLNPQRLHIVACDPATLARDLRALLDAGYRIDHLAMIDLFPQTYHLETVARLSHA